MNREKWVAGGAKLGTGGDRGGVFAVLNFGVSRTAHLLKHV